MNKKVLILLFVGVLMGALDIAIIGPALPAIKEHLFLDDRSAAWIINIYLLANLISTPLMAKLSDLFGRKNIYILNILLFALGSIVIISSNNFTFLLIGRAIQGIGAGGIFPVASAVIGDTFPKEKQGAALGMIGAVFGLAFIIGPIVGGILLLYNWHLLFAINLPIAFFLIIAASRLLPSDTKSIKFNFDWLGTSLLISILFLFSFSFNQIEARNLFNIIKRIDIMLMLTISFILIPIFLKHIQHNKSPIISPKLFKSKQLNMVYFLAFGAGIAESVIIFIPSLAQMSFNLSHSKASFMLVPLVLSLLIGAPTAGRIIDKKGSKIVVIFGVVFLTLGLILLSLMPSSYFSFYFSGGLMGLGIASLVGSPLRYIVNHETSSTDRASGQGMITLFTSVGQIITAAFIGGLITSLGGNTNSYKTTFLVVGLIVSLLIFAAFNLKSKTTEIQIT